MAYFIDMDITAPLHDGGDGIVIFGQDGESVVKFCTIDFSEYDVDNLDEALSGVNAAQAVVTDCTIRGAGKLVLWGNGDHPEADKNAKLTMCNVTMENFGRRGPEAQDGAIVILKNCTIKNWGVKDRFDTRAFGAWAHHKAQIICEDCRFEQTSFWQTGFWNFFRDLGNHIGQAVNDRGIFGLHWTDFIPGVCRGLTASEAGYVKAINCTKNKWWIRIENHHKD